MTVLINRAYRWAIPPLILWLLAWIILSWAGVQDDAFIHLRYAENLLRTHLVTYDGVHPNYGASSLLYIFLLAALRLLTSSPDLPRVVSSCVHLLLVLGLSLFFIRPSSRANSLSRTLVLILLFLLVAPSSVRWLDDGMETGLVLCFVALICRATFHQSVQSHATAPEFLAYVVLGFLAVFLRIELILLCSVSFAILAWKGLFNPTGLNNPSRRLQTVMNASSLFLGGILALLVIYLKMHHLLPDTALAKADGIANWSVAFEVTGMVLASSFAFGAGMFLLWLLTLALVLGAGGFSAPLLFANLVFPILFSLAAQRGQQIQGARYFVWALFFSVLWNIMELTRLPVDERQKKSFPLPAYCLLFLLLLALPFESHALYPMLRNRAQLRSAFQSHHLESLNGKRGIAFDIGYIGYFSNADICDLAGLVNGRSNASLTFSQHLARCVATHPDFLFLDPEAVYKISQYLPIKEWRVCSEYEFRNIRAVNPHYLMVKRSDPLEVCKDAPASIPSELQALYR